MQNELLDVLIFNPIKSLWSDTLYDLTVYLSRILAFLVRSFQSYHFKDTHSKCVNINACIIAFFIKLWSHEFRCAKYGCGVTICHWCGKAQVANSDISRVRVNEDVVAFQVSMDDRMWLLFMQIEEALQDLLAPALNDFESRVLDLFDIAS